MENVDRTKFDEIAKQYHDAKTSEEADKVIEANESVIKLANKADRKLARVGMPLSARVDSRTDEIPGVAGGKNFVKYGGGIAGLTLAGIALYQKFWG